MSLTVQNCLDHVAKVVGGYSKADGLSYINDVGEILATQQPWAWLEKQTATIDLIAGQTYAALPDGIREITGYDATNGLLNTLKFTDVGTVLQMRASDISVTTWNWHGALTYRDSDVPNSVKHSNRFDGSSWADSGTPTLVTGFSDPLGGMNATEFTVSSTADRRDQIIPYGCVTAGVNCVSIYVKKGSGGGGLIAVRDVKTTAIVMAQLSVTFGTVATVAAVGDTTFTPTIEPILDGWYRIQCGFTYDTSIHGEDGVLLQVIGGNGGKTQFFGAQINRTKFATPLVIVNGTTLPSGGEPEPVLELYPVPTADSDAALTIFYRGGWGRVKADTDVLSMPDWIEPLFKAMLRAYVKGIEEEDEGTVDQRLDSVMRGPLMAGCISRDAKIAPNVGALRGSAVSGSGTFIPAMLRNTVQGPS